MHRLEHGGGAAVRIHRSVHPRVAVIAGDDPLIGRNRSAHFANHVPDGAELVILLQVQLYFRRPGTDVISKRQRSLPLSRRGRSSEVLENRRGVSVGKRGDRNLRQLRRLGGRNALRIGQRRHRRYSRRGGIARELEHVSDRSALCRARRAPRTLGVRVAAVVTVVLRIGINNDRSRSPLLRDEGLHSTEILPIADDDDLSADVHIHLFQLVEVFGRAVVCINNFRLCIARWRHAVIGIDHARIILERIALYMLALRSVHRDAVGRRHIHADLCRIIQPDFVFNDFGLQPGFPEFLCQVLRSGFVLRRPGNVRGLGQNAQVFLGELRIGYGQETFFGFLLASHVTKSRDGGSFRLTALFPGATERLRIGSEEYKEEDCS